VVEKILEKVSFEPGMK